MRKVIKGKATSVKSYIHQGLHVMHSGGEPMRGFPMGVPIIFLCLTNRPQHIFLVSIVFQDIITGVVMDAFEHIHAEDPDGEDDEGIRVVKAVTRFERWFGMHASGVTEKESEDSIRRHAGVLLDQLNGAHRRFKIRKRSMSRTGRKRASTSFSKASLPPENIRNPLQNLIDNEEND